MRKPPRVGLNICSEDAFRAAALPLFEEGSVDAIEIDVDDTWGWWRNTVKPRARWIEDLLDLYAADAALYGHGVWFSFLTARLDDRQKGWLERLAEDCRRRPYVHITEHFGWMTSGPFAQNTLFPCPLTPAAVAVGRHRLALLAEAAAVPVGLENLTTALAPADATDQGLFLEAILAPSDSFMILDVHNIWTQSVNLGLSADDLLASYPLDLVREIHVSGGSWYEPRQVDDKRPVRLDSHDGALPDPVVPLLASALARCPNVELVIYERRGEFTGDDVFDYYRRDYRAVRALVERVCAAEEAA